MKLIFLIGTLFNIAMVSSTSCPTGYTGTYDASKPTCSALITSGICKCTGCGQIDIYMTDLDVKESCTDNGDGTATWLPTKATCDSFTCSASQVNKGSETECSGLASTCVATTCCEATCEGFKCPKSFALKTNPSGITCTSSLCSNRYDLKTCCDTSISGIYGRVEDNEENCNNAQTCDGCVDGRGRVLLQCKCAKDEDYKDYRSIIADVGDYCNKDGLWTKKTKSKLEYSTSDRISVIYMKDQLIDDPTQGELHGDTLDYFNNRNAIEEEEDTLNYGYVEAVSGKGGKTYGCSDKCIWNHKNERNIQIKERRRQLRVNLQRASRQKYEKSGTDVCKTESCALCTMCKMEAASKKYGFKPEIHKFLAPDGGEVYDAGCDATCDSKVHNLDGRVFTITAPETMVSMSEAQQVQNFNDNKSVHSPNSVGDKGKVLTINGRVGDITYAVAGQTYEITFNMAGVCTLENFKIAEIGTNGAVLYTGRVNSFIVPTFTVPPAGTDLKYYCHGDDDVIGGIIKSHKAANIQKILTCLDSACSGCTTCEELSGTEAVTENYEPDAECVTDNCAKAIDLFVPSSPDQDINGDGSRIAGGCKGWCEKAFYGVGRYWPALRSEVQAFTPDDIYDNVDAFREDKVCGWQRCSGCLHCKQRALSDDFAEKESLDDLGDTKYQRQKEARLGGCNMRGNTASNNCKKAWVSADTNEKKDALCSDRQDSGLDCTGCKACDVFFSDVESGSKQVSRDIVDAKANIKTEQQKGGSSISKKDGANRAIPCPSARLCTPVRSQQKKWQRRGCIPDCFA